MEASKTNDLQNAAAAEVADFLPHSIASLPKKLFAAETLEWSLVAENLIEEGSGVFAFKTYLLFVKLLLFVCFFSE